MKIICQYTGIEFEAASKRQKNHPKVSDLLNAAAKMGGAAYGEAKERLAQARQQGMTDIDQIIQFARTGAAEANDAAAHRNWLHDQEKKQAERDRHYARNERENTNRILRDHGYSWHKEDEESMDAFGASAFDRMYGNRDHVWILSAPDGREVSVRQAIEAIAQHNDARAQHWLDEHPTAPVQTPHASTVDIVMYHWHCQECGNNFNGMRKHCPACGETEMIVSWQRHQYGAPV